MENTKGINYYIVVAHLDDIEFGLTKYLGKITEKDKVFIYIASGGFYKHKDSTNFARKQTQLRNIHEIFSNNFKIMVHIEPNLYDTLFFKNKNEIRNSLENWISDKFSKLDNQKNILISIASDIHEDHRIISELCDVVARPNLENFLKSNFSDYFKFYIPGNHDYMYKYNLGIDYKIDCVPKYITDLTLEELRFKEKLLRRYPKEIIKSDFVLPKQEMMLKIY